MPNPLDSLLNEATDIAGNNLNYVNTTRFTITPNEIFVDFYNIVPSSVDPSKPSAIRMHRIVMPLSSAKDFAEKLLQGIAHWEGTYGINLPLEADNELDKTE